MNNYPSIESLAKLQSQSRVLPPKLNPVKNPTIRQPQRLWNLAYREATKRTPPSKLGLSTRDLYMNLPSVRERMDRNVYENVFRPSQTLADRNSARSNELNDSEEALEPVSENIEPTIPHALEEGSMISSTTAAGIAAGGNAVANAAAIRPQLTGVAEGGVEDLGINTMTPSGEAAASAKAEANEDSTINSVMSGIGTAVGLGLMLL